MSPPVSRTAVRPGGQTPGPPMGRCGRLRKPVAAWMANPTAIGPTYRTCRARRELLTTFGPTNPPTCPGRGVNDIPPGASPGPNRLHSPLTSMVASLIWSALPVVGFVLRRWFYAAAGVSTVPAADTALTPATWHRLAEAT